LKITIPQKYLVSSPLKVNVKLWYSVPSNHFIGVQWKELFFVKMKLGADFNISFVTVPIEALVHPLCVIPDRNCIISICNKTNTNLLLTNLLHSILR
jgi:hypothetical protein